MNSLNNWEAVSVKHGEGQWARASPLASRQLNNGNYTAVDVVHLVNYHYSFSLKNFERLIGPIRTKTNVTVVESLLI